jgi:hypothetical protein
MVMNTLGNVASSETRIGIAKESIMNFKETIAQIRGAADKCEDDEVHGLARAIIDAFEELDKRIAAAESKLPSLPS